MPNLLTGAQNGTRSASRGASQVRDARFGGREVDRRRQRRGGGEEVWQLESPPEATGERVEGRGKFFKTAPNSCRAPCPMRFLIDVRHTSVSHLPILRLVRPDVYQFRSCENVGGCDGIRTVHMKVSGNLHVERFKFKMMCCASIPYWTIGQCDLLNSCSKKREIQCCSVNIDKYLRNLHSKSRQSLKLSLAF